MIYHFINNKFTRQFPTTCSTTISKSEYPELYDCRLKNSLRIGNTVKQVRAIGHVENRKKQLEALKYKTLDKMELIVGKDGRLRVDYNAETKARIAYYEKKLNEREAAYTDLQTKAALVQKQMAFLNKPFEEDVKTFDVGNKDYHLEKQEQLQHLLQSDDVSDTFRVTMIVKMTWDIAFMLANSKVETECAMVVCKSKKEASNLVKWLKSLEDRLFFIKEGNKLSFCNRKNKESKKLMNYVWDNVDYIDTLYQTDMLEVQRRAVKTNNL